MSDAKRIFTGTALTVTPVWMDAFTWLWQIALSLGGAIVLGLTIYKLILEIKIRRKTLRE